MTRIGRISRQAALGLAICLLPTICLAFDFSVPAELGTKDAIHTSTLYLHDFHRGSQSYAAQAVNYGPIWQLSHKGVWIADFFSVSAVGSVALQPETQGSQVSGMFGFMPVNILGIQGGIYYNPFTGRPSWGVGFDLLNAVRRIAPPVTNAVTIAVTPPAAPTH